MRPLLRLGIEPNRFEIDELAVELSLLLGPKRLHRQHALAKQLKTGLITVTMVLHLLDVPTTPHRKNEPAARKLVEPRNRFGGDDLFSIGGVRNPGPRLRSAPF